MSVRTLALGLGVFMPDLEVERDDWLSEDGDDALQLVLRPTARYVMLMPGEDIRRAARTKDFARIEGWLREGAEGARAWVRAGCPDARSGWRKVGEEWKR